jgi:hypothetical protein
MTVKNPWDFWRDVDDGDTVLAGFVRSGSLEVVDPRQPNIQVGSRATESDAPWGNDYAQAIPTALPLPAGHDEDVPNASLTLDAPPSSDGSEFHYSVEVAWSVSYGP